MLCGVGMDSSRDVGCSPELMDEDELELLPVFGCWGAEAGGPKVDKPQGRLRCASSLLGVSWQQPAAKQALARTQLRVTWCAMIRIPGRRRWSLSGSRVARKSSTSNPPPAIPTRLDWSIERHSEAAELIHRAQPKWRPYYPPCGRREPWPPVSSKSNDGPCRTLPSPAPASPFCAPREDGKGSVSDPCGQSSNGGRLQLLSRRYESSTFPARGRKTGPRLTGLRPYRDGIRCDGPTRPLYREPPRSAPPTRSHLCPYKCSCRPTARQGCTVVVPFREEMGKRHLKVTGDLGRIVFIVWLPLLRDG